MTSTISIPTLADLPAILALWHQTDIYHQQLDPVYYTPSSKSESRHVEEYISRAITDHNPELRIAVAEGKTVGFVTFEYGEADYFDTNIQRYIEIIELFVDPSARKSGVASALVDAAENFAREHQVPFLKLQMSAKNTLASEFYARQGFTHRQSLLFKPVGE